MSNHRSLQSTARSIAWRHRRRWRSGLFIAALIATHLLGCDRHDPLESTTPYLDLAAALPLAATTFDSEAAIPRVELDGRILVLPTGTSVGYAFQLREGTWLSIDRIDPGTSGAQLTIEIEFDATGRRPLAQIERLAAQPAWAIKGDEGTPVRLILGVTGGSSEDQEAGVRLEHPTIRAQRPATDPVPEIASSGQTGGRQPGATEPRTDEVATPRPNIIIYMIDTLRRDRLGCYGYPRPITPHLDAFAAHATRFADAIAQSSWTKASVASIFSGVWPPAHGATGWKHKLPKHFDTLAEVLNRGGYRTMALSTNPNVVNHYSMGQGFDDFITRLKTPSTEVNRITFEWLDEHGTEEPFFLYLHTMDPHAPYGPPEPFRGRFAPTADQMPKWKPRWRWPLEVLPFLDELYDADIAYNDDSFGQLVANLEERGLYDNNLIIVVSDHGEEFKEHGQWRHGNNLFSPTLNVPLIIKYPGQTDGRTVSATVQHLDLMPTILEIAGLPVPIAATGHSLVSLSAPGAPSGAPSGERIFSHLRLGRSPLVHSVIDGEYKLIRSVRPEQRQLFLFHRPSDPGDDHDLAAEMPVRAAMMDAWLTAELLRSTTAQPVEEAVLDEKMKEDLKALGYL